ncbi:MAG: HNH endonuclease signature motif containing protein, partial [Chloroflexota bacterium]
SNRSRHNALYSTRAWQRLSARVLRAWRGEHGDWCPGFQRPAHAASDLTVDHVVPLAVGGAPFDIGNCAVLCRSCNSSKGASAPVSVARVGLTGHRGGRRPGWGSPHGDTDVPGPRPATVCTRPSFANYPGC